MSTYIVEPLISRLVSAHDAFDVSILMEQLRGITTNVGVDQLVRMAGANYIAVAREGTGGGIIGMACLVTMDLPQGTRMLAESVVVHKDHRRQGVGTALMQELINEARRRGDGHLTLTCNPMRVEARQLYSALGFAPADTEVLRVPLSAGADR